MNFYRTYLIVFAASALSLCSCSDKKKEIASNEIAENINPDVINPFKLKGKRISDEYLKEKREKLERFYEKNWPNKTMNGGFIVAKNGEIIFEKYNGKANFRTGEEINSKTALHIASVSKVLTAAVVLKLVDREKLALETEVQEILPTFPYKDITIKMLLNHRSGLPNYAYFADDRKIWDRNKMLQNQDILDLMAKHKFSPYFMPDRKFGYCNTNYAILALVIEKVTGKKYPEVMKEMVFEPLGMKDTFVYKHDRDKETASQSYKGNKVLYETNHLDDVYGDKNIYSTPRDLVKFDLATYSDTFLNKVLLSEVYKGYSYESKGTRNYGLGIRLLEWETGEELFYHNGWWHGNTSSYVKLKNDTVTMIALSNKFSYKPYKILKLSPVFGKYPIKADEGDSAD